ncbi:MAG TPA: cobalamin-binding protein [bacterium]|jgi:iron complex transport system substrate-binding protein
MRIATLLPSATEIVCALGLSESLVGISHDCDYPPEIRRRPVLSEAIVGAELPSRTIDERIRGQVHKGKSVYHLDERQLAQLRPDLILTQELCEVCAPSYSLVKQAAKVLDADTKIVSLEPLGLMDVLDNILLVGELTGAAARAAHLVGILRDRIERVKMAVAGLPAQSVVCLEWLDPLFVAGHWVPEMVEDAGGRELLGRSRQPSFVVEWETIRAADPEVLVVMPCGFDIPRVREEMHLLTDRPGWDGLRAVREGQVYLTEATSYFSRPGPRLVDGLEILASILHPEIPQLEIRAGSVQRL